MPPTVRPPLGPGARAERWTGAVALAVRQTRLIAGRLGSDRVDEFAECGRDPHGRREADTEFVVSAS